jgi:hypothetical protein
MSQYINIIYVTVQIREVELYQTKAKGQLIAEYMQSRFEHVSPWPGSNKWDFIALMKIWVQR